MIGRLMARTKVVMASVALLPLERVVLCEILMFCVIKVFSTY